VLRALLAVLGLFPIGSVVRLSDDRLARVVASRGTDSSRRLVSILAPPGTSEPPAPRFVCLADTPDLKSADADVELPESDVLVGF